jgi:hypothetical protein
MTTLSLTFTEPARVTLTSDGGLSLGFPSPQAVTLSAVGLQGPPGVGGGGGVTDGDKGDITVSGSGAAWTIDAGAVTLSKMADLASSTILGRATAGTGVPEALTAAQVRTILNVANGATANQADAFLLSRANHTGTQAAATITGLAAVATSGSAADLTTGTLPAARFDDTSHGARAGGTLHANVIAGGAAGFMTGADKTKLDGVATGATANATDAALRDRATHTGTQLAATISDFATAVAATAAVTANTAKVTNATHTGDVTGATALTIAANAVDNTKAADMATARIKGRVTAGTGDPEDLTGTQATTLLDVFTTSLKGLAPASGGGTTNFLRADGNWAAPPGGGGGGSVLSGNVTLTLSTGRYEHQETVTATGVTGTNRISVWLDPATDDDENVPEMTDLITMAAAPGTNQITVTAAFHIPHSGPLKIQWSAF